MSDGEMIDISKIKRGDMVTVGPLEVRGVIPKYRQVMFYDDDKTPVYFTTDQILTHTPAPREIKAGDRVVFTATGGRGTVEHVANDKAWCRWDNGSDAIWSLSSLTIVEDGE